MGLKRWLVAGGLLWAVGCTRPNPDYCDTDHPCAGDRVCDLTGVLGSRNACVSPVCSPGEVVACDGQRAETCAANQLGTVTEECEFGCTDSGCMPCPPGGKTCREHEPEVYEVAVCAEDGSVIDRRDCVLGCADAERCIDIAPSNDLGADLDFIDENLVDVADLTLADGYTVHSDGTITDAAGQPVEVVSSRERTPGGGAPMRVFRVRSLAITGEVVLAGPDVIAFAAIGDISIDGVLIARAGATADPSNACVGEEGTAATLDGSGSGGGGFASTGGAGGGAGGLDGGDGGQSFGNATLIPLLGGCAGGGPMGGSGGGGVQLVSRSRILVGPGAGINAGGLGGGAAVSLGGATPPGGGGSGGAVLLEAPVIDIAETGFIAANGGGGGCSAPMVSAPGGDGALSDAQAPGGDCMRSNSGRGGAGGSKAGSREDGQTGTDVEGGVADGGGGGGGSFGRIRVNTVLGAPSSSRFSPDAETGTLDTR